MKAPDYVKLTEESNQRRLEIFRRKNHDYADEDALSNFKRVAQVAEIWRPDITKPNGVAEFLIIVKLDRYFNLQRQGKKPKNEPLNDTLDDKQNYVDLLRAILEEKKRKTESVYLAHSRRHRLDGKWIQHQLEGWGYKVYNPFDYDEQACELTSEWERAEEANDEEWLRALCLAIRRKDEGHIAESDAMVVYYPDESTGTSQEIAIAKRLGKTVYVLTEMIHPFIYDHADHVLPWNDDGLQKLRKLLEGETP